MRQEDHEADLRALAGSTRAVQLQVAQALLAVRRGDRNAAEVHLANAQRGLLALQAHAEPGARHD